MVAIPPLEVHANSSREGFTNIHLTIADPSFPYKTPSPGGGQLSTRKPSQRLHPGEDLLHDRHPRTGAGAGSPGGADYQLHCGVPQDDAAFSEPVEKIREGILKNYSRVDFSLDEVIRQQPFHYDYLRKRFKKEVGVSPLEYMTNLRMKSAEMLLTAMWANEYTVSEIARMCGYDDALYFSRVFKKHYGCSQHLSPKKEERKQAK